MSSIRRRTTRRVRGNSRSVRSMENDDSVLTEHEAQRKFVMWFRQTIKGVRIFAIPNGGYRGKRQAMQLKAEGVSKGVPDLFCPELFLWIEMKRAKGGIVSADQKDWLEYLESVGYKTMVCRGLADAKAQVVEFLQIGEAFRSGR